ncbi:hypothetical protein [Saccharothrix syringae]|uniref:hypothetical protein n=1 Tax=Saccharothrix syringae TaxID=103733 RepID=UPI00068B1ACE|nr:hypothetical protein [Saccharothrix syringae]
MTPPNSPQDNQATTTTYAGQTEAELRAEYERARDENPGVFGFITSFDDYLRYRQQTAQYQARQQQELEQDVEQYRPPMPSACPYYMGYDHKALKSMVSEDMDPVMVNQQGEVWNKVGNTLVGLQDNLTKATEASKGAWRGQAAEAAQTYFTNVAAWSGNTAQGAQLMGNRVYTQSSAAETAKNAMPEPVDFSTADAYRMFFSEPNPFKWAETIDKIEQKFEEKQQAHERAAEVMTELSTNYQQSASNTPAFTSPPAMSGGGANGESSNTGTGEISGRPTVPSGVGSGNGTGSGSGFGDLPGGGGGSGGGSTNPSWTGPGTLPGGGGGGGGGGVNPPNNPGLPPGTYPPGTYPPGTGPGQQRPGVPGGTRPGGTRPGLPTGPGGPGGRPGGGPGMGGGRGGGGLGGPGGLAAAGGRGGLGAGGLGGFGPGGSSGALGESGRSGAAGFGPGGSGGLGGPGAAGGRGGAGAGMGGMGAGAGGGGRGEEDKEHKSASYLVETEDVFGDGTMVAPPVIGG